MSRGRGQLDHCEGCGVCSHLKQPDHPMKLRPSPQMKLSIGHTPPLSAPPPHFFLLSSWPGAAAAWLRERKMGRRLRKRWR